jgi:hypothetical protein
VGIAGRQVAQGKYHLVGLDVATVVQTNDGPALADVNSCHTSPETEEGRGALALGTGKGGLQVEAVETAGKEAGADGRELNRAGPSREVVRITGECAHHGGGRVEDVPRGVGAVRHAGPDLGVPLDEDDTTSTVAVGQQVDGSEDTAAPAAHNCDGRRVRGGAHPFLMR